MKKVFIIFMLLSIFLIFYIGCVIYNNYYNNINVYENLRLNKLGIGSKYIPKKIYQLIQDKNDINISFQKNIDYIKNLNPTWIYTLLDDNDMIDYIKKHYPPYILEIYNYINPKYGAAKADFFRYLLMYIEGGAYFDIKSAMEYPLDNIIKYEDEYILTHDKCRCQRHLLNNYEGEFQQWHIICKPEHPFLKIVIENVIKNILNYNINIDGTAKLGVLKVTGPIAYTKSILPILSENKHTIYEQPEHIGLIYNNISKTHVSLFTSKHYSKINEPIIIKKKL